MSSSNDDRLFDAAAEALVAVLAMVRERARTDAALRDHLATLGRALLALAETPPAESPAADDAPEVAAALEAPPPPPTDPPAPIFTPATAADLHRLKQWAAGNSADPDPPPRAPLVAPALPADALDHLVAISEGCARKAALVAWRATATHSTPPPSDLGALPPSSAWLAPRLAAPTISAAVWTMLAGCYDATTEIAETLALFEQADVGPGEYRQRSLEPAAEVQSALRAAVAGVTSSEDSDQRALYQWLRTRTGKANIYIPRYMRSNERADPQSWEERLTRVRTLRDDITLVVNRRCQQRKLLGRLRYQLGQFAAGHETDWPRALATVEALHAGGMAPSDRHLRGLLASHLPRLQATADLSPPLRLVVRDLERAAATGAPAPELPPSAEETPHITATAHLLRGRSVVLIGGDRRPPVESGIIEAFELQELVWCDTRPHRSHLPLEPDIARSDVAVVLLAIRWASHNLGEVKTFCDRYGKPLVRLPGGYNVAQIAYQVLRQAGERLGTSAGALAA